MLIVSCYVHYWRYRVLLQHAFLTGNAVPGCELWATDSALLPLCTDSSQQLINTPQLSPRIDAVAHAIAVTTSTASAVTN
jgi:hypothetical protein